MRANNSAPIPVARWQSLVPWLALIALVLLSRPFRGIYHDAHLYAFQALRYLGETQLNQDIYFAYGNQDDFTTFTRIYAPLIQALGLNHANMVGYGIGLLVWFFALVVFARVFFEDRKALLMALLGAVALSPSYGSGVLSYGEGFVSPRIFAEAMGLLSIAALLRNRYALSGMTALAAILLHPLMGMVIFAVLAWFIVRDIRLYLGLCLLGVSVMADLGWFGIAPFAWIWEWMDHEWFMLAHAHDTLVFPTEWGISGYATLPLKLLVTWIIVTRDTGLRQSFGKGILIVAGLLMVVTMIMADLLGNRLFVGLQLWRVLFFLALFGNMMAVRAVTLLPKGLARQFLILAIGMNAFEAAFGLSPILSACLALVSIVAIIAEVRQLRTLRTIIRITGIATLIFVLSAATTIAVTSAFGQAHVLRFVTPLFVLCAIAAVLVVPSSRIKGYIGGALAIVALIGSIATLDRRNPWERYVESTADMPPSLIDTLKNKTVYWEQGQELLWFKFRMPQYYSCRQKAGSVFFRDQAIEIIRRANVLSHLNSADFFTETGAECPAKADPDAEGPTSPDQLAVVCNALPELDLLVLHTPLDNLYRRMWVPPGALSVLASEDPEEVEKAFFYFYDCTDFRT